jgi:hypothetical protein
MTDPGVYRQGQWAAGTLCMRAVRMHTGYCDTYTKYVDWSLTVSALVVV